MGHTIANAMAVSIRLAPSPLYSEAYVVTFWQIGSDGYASQQKATYYTASRGRHREVEKFCIRDKNLKSKAFVVNVIYQ